MDAPRKEFYTREAADLLPDVRGLMALYRDRNMSAEELAARLHQQDGCVVQAVLEALELDDGIAA